MRKNIKNATHEQKIEYVLTVLEAAEKRRSAVENKSSILIAANAFLLSSVIGFGFGFPDSSNQQNWLFWIQFITAVLAIGSVIFSVLLVAEVLSPISTFKQRRKIMDLGKNEQSESNIFLFTSIAGLKKEDFQNKVENLTEDEIIKQLTSQIHNLSRINQRRYESLRISQIAFVVGVISLALLAFVQIFW